MNLTEKAFEIACEKYREYGVDVSSALTKLASISISIHAWQGDDVVGFEKTDHSLTGGCQVTGNYPGRARTADELRSDLEVALSHPDKKIRKFWINHGKNIRRVAAKMGERFGSPSVCNVWVPDGFKDTPADRYSPRLRLQDSLDEIFSEELPHEYLRDAVESKLFGIGVESYTVGSHDFCMDYFDASINRIAAWVIGVRNLQKALLSALLEPHKRLCELENKWDLAGRLALQEESKLLPLGAVWEYYCLKNNVKSGFAVMDEIRKYESGVLKKRV